MALAVEEVLSSAHFDGEQVSLFVGLNESLFVAQLLHVLDLGIEGVANEGVQGHGLAVTVKLDVAHCLAHKFPALVAPVEHPEGHGDVVDNRARVEAQPEEGATQAHHVLEGGLLKLVGSKTTLLGALVVEHGETVTLEGHGMAGLVRQMVVQVVVVGCGSESALSRDERLAVGESLLQHF